MRRFIYTVIVLFIATISVFAKRNIAPGEWQTIRTYNGITSIIPSKEKVYVVANGGMYSYDKKTKEVKPLSTLDGLSASAIEMVEYVESTKTLFIIHSDMTIDLVVEGMTFSDESIKDSEISGKKVNSLKVDGDNVYISMNAGIVVYNTKKREVLDTYIIGDDGEYEAVYQTIVFNNDIYALMADRSHCSQRKIRVCKDGKNANDFNAWESVALPITCPVDSVVVKTMDCSSGHVLLLTSEGLYALLGDGTWVDVSPRGIVPDTIQVYKNRLTAITRWQVMAFHKDNLGDMKYRECWSKIAVYDVDEDVVWHDNGDGLRIADMSVDELKATVSEPIKFDGPSQNDYYSLEVVDGEIYLTGNDGYNTPVVVDYSKEGKWYNLRDSLKDDNLRFFRSGHVIAVDPTDKNHVMVPTWWGIYEFYKDSLLRVHNKENASFFETSGTSCTYVECVWFDEENNVIATNPSSSGYLLHAMNKDGEWTALKHNNLTGQRYARRHLKTKSGIDIVVFEYKPIGLGFVDMNGTTFDASDDKTKLVASFKYMEDGVMETFQPSYVFSVEEDLKGDIWIATDQGPLIMKNVKGVFDGKESYVRPKITREDDSRYADYLLASDKVRKIQVLF